MHQTKQVTPLAFKVACYELSDTIGSVHGSGAEHFRMKNSYCSVFLKETVHLDDGSRHKKKKEALMARES